MTYSKTANKSKSEQSKPYIGLKFYHWVSFAFPMVACAFLGATSNHGFAWTLLSCWILLLFPPTSFFLYFSYFTFFLFPLWGVRAESIVAFAGGFYFLITVTGTIGLCILFRKRGIPKYNVFIPIVGIDRLFHTVGLSRWYFILLYIPLIGSILGFVCVLKLIKLTTKEKGLSSFLSLLFFSGLYLLDAGIKVRKAEKRSTILLYFSGVLLLLISPIMIYGNYVILHEGRLINAHGIAQNTNLDANPILIDIRRSKFSSIPRGQPIFKNISGISVANVRFAIIGTNRNVRKELFLELPPDAEGPLPRGEGWVLEPDESIIVSVDGYPDRGITFQ